MRASKENAKACAKTLAKGPPFNRDEIAFLRDFIEAAIKKLPTEASYDKDKKRERKSAKSNLAHPAD